MKLTIKMILILLVFVLTLSLTTGLTEGNSDREILLPELGIAFTLPEGFGENIADPEESVTFRAVNAEAGYELYITEGGALYPSKKPTMVDKVKENRNIWEDVTYGEHEFFIYKSEISPGSWTATIMFEDYYTPMIGLIFPEPNDDPFPLAEEILASVRFINDNEAKRISLLYTQ